MKENSLIQLLRSLTPEELRKLDKFLRSPYFTEGKNLSSGIIYRYFEILRQYYPKFNGEELNPEKLYLKLYPAGNINLNIMRKLNSDLLSLIEKFLSLEQYETDETEQRFNLLFQLVLRKIEKVFKRRFDETLKYLEAINKDEAYYIQVHRIWNLNKTYILQRRSPYKLVEAAERDENFFIFAILVSLNIYLHRVSVSFWTPKIRKMPLYEEILSHIQSNYKMYKKIPQIIVHYNLIKMFETRQEQYYYELKKLKRKEMDTLSDASKYNLYIMMRNFCISIMVPSGKFSYREELFKIDKKFLKTNYTAKWELHINHFIEIAKNAVKLNKFSWAEKFINEFNSKINPHYRDDAVNYVKALAYFQQKNFNKAMGLISIKTKIDYSTQKQFIRDLILQIHYENGEDELVLSLIDTSRHFLHRDTNLNEEQKNKSLAFLGFSEKLVKLRSKPSVDQILMLRKTITDKQSIEKEWLLEKADEIMKSVMRKKVS